MEIEDSNFNINDFHNSNLILASLNDDFNINNANIIANSSKMNIHVPTICDLNVNGFKSSGYDELQACNSEINVQSRIKYLEEELANTIADKEFVWSLWRQLQSTNPDITSCIGSVVKREKEKAELKDRKVLEILKVKDDKINELYETFQIKEKEIIDLNNMLKRTENQLQAKIEEVKYMEVNSKTFSDKESMYEQMLRSRDDKYDKAMKENESDKQHLISKLRDLVKETAECQERESCLRTENAKQNQMIEMLNTEIRQSNENYEKLMKELNNFKSQLNDNLKYENEQLYLENKTKQDQNESLRKELNELWSKFNLNVDYSSQQESIIKQLKQTQSDLQKSIKAQKETYEQENENYKKMYEQVYRKYEETLKQEKQTEYEKKHIQQKLEQEKNLQTQQFKLNEKSSLETIRALNYEIEQLRLQNSLQSQQLNDKKVICDELTKRIDQLEARSINLKNTKTFCEVSSSQISSDEINSKKLLKKDKNIKLRANSLRSKSFSRISEKPFPQTIDSEESSSHNKIKRSKSFDKDASSNKSKFNSKQYPSNEFNSSFTDKNDLKQFYENLCIAKDKQLETIRIAHQRRLERLISLEKQYKLLKDHLRSYVDEENHNDGHHHKKHHKHTCSALNDTGLPCVGNHSENINGYTRNDTELMRNQLKVFRHQNEKLLQENLDQKEEIDILNVKCGEQNERIQHFKLQLSSLSSEQEDLNSLREKQFKQDLKQNNEKLKKSNEEINQLKISLSELESKYSQLFKERSKYIELSSKLSDENKKLYNRWYQLRTNENKFRKTVIEQMNKNSPVQNKRNPFRVCSKKYRDGTESSNDLLKRLINSSGSSTPKMLSDESLSSSVITLNEYDWESSSDISNSTPKKSKITSDGLKQVKAKIKKFKQLKTHRTVSLIQKKFEKFLLEKRELKSKLTQSNKEIEKLNTKLINTESKLRKHTAENERYVKDISNMKRKEEELKDREAVWKRQEEQAKDEIKKPLENKIRQFTSDLCKLKNTIKNLKNEKEILNDKLKVTEEKLNHSERDILQKKQLIDFYKKKIEEFNNKEKDDAKSISEIAFDSIQDLKSQIKKLNEIIDKSKVEIKSLKTRIQVAQSEKALIEEKFMKQEKLFSEMSAKLDANKKEKLNKENQCKQLKQKIAEFESYIENLETTAESKIRTLSDATHQTLTIAQYRLKYAFKSVENYENIFKFLYESLIKRCLELRRDIKYEKNDCKENVTKSKINEDNKKLDENMKIAMDLASNVLNLTSNEIEDILSSSSMTIDNQHNKSKQKEVKDDDTSYKKHCKKLLSEFEQKLNLSKKEKQIKDLNDVEKEFERLENEDINKDLCDLISQRLNDVLIYERELASLNALRKN